MHFWSLGPHCRSLAHGYRFVDPQWEADFQRGGQSWALLLARWYAAVTLLRSFTGVLDFRRYFVLRASLVLHFFICASMTGLLLGTFCSRHVRQHIVPVLTASCCTLAVCYCYIMTENVYVWASYALDQFLPTLMSLSEDAAVRQRAQELFRLEEATKAVYVHMLWNFNHWIVLATLGFSRFTVGAYFVVQVALFIALALDPNVGMATCVQTIICSTLTIGPFLSIGIVLERLRRTNFLSEALLTRELQASQMADSMLNHTLKNLLADVAANIEVFLAGSAPSNMLEDSVTCLRRGMMACKERQVYLKLVSGEYVPILQEVNLKQFGQQLVAGRGVRVEAVDLSVHLDGTICSLILENALSNAFRHGNPENPHIRLIIESLGSLPHTRQGFKRIRMTVENAADPERPPLTPEDAERLFQGQAHLVSDVRVPTLSDRVGIVHCVLAAQVSGIALSLTQDGNVVRFTAELDALVVPQPAARHVFDWPPSNVGQDFPSGLRFCCLDDSKAALRLLELHIQTWCAPSIVHLMGNSEEDVHCFVPFALQNADVVILDQHLEYSQTYYGTDLVAELREQGFLGLLCIRSANDAAEDRERFCRAGAHCCFGKDVLGSCMMDELKAAYVQLKGCRPSSFFSPHPTTVAASSSASTLAPAGPAPEAHPPWPSNCPFSTF